MPSIIDMGKADVAYLAVIAELALKEIAAHPQGESCIDCGDKRIKATMALKEFASLRAALAQAKEA